MLSFNEIVLKMNKTHLLLWESIAEVELLEQISSEKGALCTGPPKPFTPTPFLFKLLDLFLLSWWMLFWQL